jgi:hypothetical protein
LCLSNFFHSTLKPRDYLTSRFSPSPPPPPFTARAFQILMSDIISCRLWVGVKPVEFYNPVTSLLSGGADYNSNTGQGKEERRLMLEDAKGQAEGGAAGSEEEDEEEEHEEMDEGEEGGAMELAGGAAAEEDEDEDDDGGLSGEESEEEASWSGMRTVAELRRDASKPVPVNKDSLYKPIVRQTRQFNPIPVPASLEAKLPFKSKTKNLTKKSKTGYVAKRAVVLEPGEKKKMAFLQALGTVRNEKKAKRHAKQQEKTADLQKKKRQTEAKFDLQVRAAKKAKFREMGQEQKRRDSGR